MPIAVTLALSVSLISEACGQVTAKTLIGDAVKETSSRRYADIGKAIQRFDNNDPLAARKFLEAAKESHPKLPPVDMMMAKMYFVKGQTAAGRQSLEATVREVPGDPEPFLLLADQSFKAGQLIQAMALYEKSIDLVEKYSENPRRQRKFSIRARAGRSAVHQRWRNWKAAEADIRAWIKVDPEEGNAYNRLGTVLFMLGQEREGYAAFAKSKELKNDFASPYVSAATLYYRLASAEKDQGKKETFLTKAQQSFERAYKENPSDKTTLVAYGNWLVQSGNLQTAAKVLAAARKAHPGVYQVFLLSGIQAQMANNLDEARKFYNQTLVLAPGNRDANNQLALLLINSQETDDHARAEQIARINAQLNPKSSDANITLAWVLRQRGSGAAANQAYQKGIRLGSMGADTSLLVAKLLIEQNRQEVAQGLIESAIANAQGVFVNRAEAEALLETLK